MNIDDFKNGTPMPNEQQKIKLGIVGHGFVGKAVDYAFTHELLEKYIVDPKYNYSIDDLCKEGPVLTFITAPTPMHDNGTVDASIVEDAVLKLIKHTASIVVIKSTITPDIINRLYNSIHDQDKVRLTYNPEFLTENNSVEQFIYASHHIIGGASPEACSKVTEFYQMFSMCVSNQFFTMTPQEASFVKYAINSYLGMKVTFFNQLHDAALDFSCSPQRIINSVSADNRIGFAHTRVPGFDGKKGFGGACLPKDMNAFVKFNEDLTLIAESVKINNKIREEYELDEREKTNNIKFEDK
jgi:UDPglucose 6-dehydrogenase